MYYISKLNKKNGQFASLLHVCLELFVFRFACLLHVCLHVCSTFNSFINNYRSVKEVRKIGHPLRCFLLFKTALQAILAHFKGK